MPAETTTRLEPDWRDRARAAGRSIVAALSSGRRCRVCGDAAGANVCAACLARFATPRRRCARCALPLDAAPPSEGPTSRGSEAGSVDPAEASAATSGASAAGRPGPREARDRARCAECRRDPPPFDAAVAAVDYAFPWDRLIGDYKFRADAGLASTLAALLSRALDAAASGAGPVERVVPLPASRERLAERGFDPAWEIARRVAAARGLPADARAIERVGAVDVHQVGAGRAERLTRLRDAFWAAPAAAAALRGRRVALVDDVMTTGASARAAAAALRAAGAASVVVWVVARTPDPSR